jgi:hypothetical protein
MLAVLSTVAVLALLWLLASLLLGMIGESGGKILAALKGQSFAPVSTAVVPVRVRYRASTQARPVRAKPRMRAAA